MSRHQTTKIRNTLSQASIPKREITLKPHSARGLLLRGCVTATYVVDDPGRGTESHWLGEVPVAVYCDVMCYSGIPGQRFIYLRKVLVSQDRGGIHNGKVWKPRATAIDITGDYVADGGTNPMNWDGDHVLVGFMEDNFNLPVILRGIPHPAQDTGGVDKEKGHRLRLKVADGDPDFIKHYGSFYGLDDKGDFIVDLTEAYTGSLETNGNEPVPPGDGSVGNYRVKLPVASKYILDIDGGPTLELDLKDADATLKLGDGAVHAAIAETLQTFWDNNVKTTLETWGGPSGHLHSTGVGPSGPPTPALTIPAFDVAIISSKLSFPDA